MLIINDVCKVSVSEVTVKASLHRSQSKLQIAKCWPPGGSLSQPMQGKVRPELEGMGLPPINSKDGQRGCKSEAHCANTSLLLRTKQNPGQSVGLG